ncbi:hypothetical protein RE2895_17810 [Rhodococcus erythropolis]|nr:hypothetical protein RE2895_17810 [Rhodococcus erythropolis]
MYFMTFRQGIITDTIGAITLQTYRIVRIVSRGAPRQLLDTWQSVCDLILSSPSLGFGDPGVSADMLEPQRRHVSRRN